MNIDFFQKLKDNIQSGMYIIPESFLYHVSGKYSIPISELRSKSKEILNLVLPIFLVDKQKEPDTYYTHKPKKPNILIDIPIAEFQNIK